MTKSKILLYDIETFPNLAYVWGKYDQNVIAFKEEWQLASVAWKWLGESTVHCQTVQGNKTDLALCETLHDLLSEADIVIAHNGDEFDQKKVRARMVTHKMQPLPPITSIDTKKVAKKYFNFTSNSLNDLGKTLGVGKKVQTGGFDLWLDCMAGKKEAWKKMATYNRQDVVLLEKVFQRMRPWMDKAILIPTVAFKSCPHCESEDVKKDGIRGNGTTVKQEWECNSCKKYFRTPLRRALN